MKVIHVAGWSGSGKTTFILDLVAALSPLGRVGTIKHIGDHVCGLPAGKDTTLHYEAGAGITIGIDLAKTMITNRTVSLSDALDILSDAGVCYAVLEGFKKIPFQKVVVGDLETPALARNPQVQEVIALLPRFDDYYTLAGLAREIEVETDEGIFSLMAGDLQAPSSPDCYARLEEEVSKWDGITGIRVRINTPVVHEKSRFLIVVRAKTVKTGLRALDQCMAAFVT